jgi:hypothetical protein
MSFFWGELHDCTLLADVNRTLDKCAKPPFGVLRNLATALTAELCRKTVGVCGERVAAIRDGFLRYRFSDLVLEH